MFILDHGHPECATRALDSGPINHNQPSNGPTSPVHCNMHRAKFASGEWDMR